MSLCATGILASGVKLFAGETLALPALDDFKIPLWYQDYTIRNGWGYKDNVLLSSAPRSVAVRFGRPAGRHVLSLAFVWLAVPFAGLVRLRGLFQPNG
jgi:hypothetical protein